jgi:polyphosphate kinase 2 (PPK2 family)
VSKHNKRSRDPHGGARYEAALRSLQIELVKLQSHVIKHSHKVLVIFEGRDAAGVRPALSLLVSHPTVRAHLGIFSVTSGICQQRRK